MSLPPPHHTHLWWSAGGVGGGGEGDGGGIIEYPLYDDSQDPGGKFCLALDPKDLKLILSLKESFYNVVYKSTVW